MLKNTPMRIFAVLFAFAVAGCVDDGITPQGVDDIEENTDDNFGPDVLKNDVDPLEPKENQALPGFEDDHTRPGIQSANVRPDTAQRLPEQEFAPAYIPNAPEQINTHGNPATTFRPTTPSNTAPEAQRR